ncbi:hypothetical protein CBR_g45387 [Chara braunii]|uniref:Uncharacterized protein n=1 Tax=Chara braunii TaxID=69332 RepID=A0A388LYD1_CHABU|nr:hypothetical protein CBR_g45387 [Chara braunii]|eukprot:GBG87328.1 hypothetical protein CBR_g45387 [Chara braunii]
MVMPFLILNLGGEMMYILDQRLRAQAIPPDKSRRVIHDIAQTIFDPEFIAELLKPQEIYSTKSVHQIFVRLAHSSIMHLSQTSMEKLYDLMAMGFKFQLLSSSPPEEIMEITERHAEGIRKLLSDPRDDKLAEDALLSVRQIAVTLTPGDWATMKQTLCAFFKDKMVKVSMFIQEGIQAQDGSFIMRLPSPAPREDLESAGMVRNWGGRMVRNREREAEGVTSVEDDAGRSLLFPLGCNMYAKLEQSKRGGAPESQKIRRGSVSSIPVKGSGPKPGERGRRASIGVEGDALQKRRASIELDMLAEMIGANTKVAAPQPKINLFRGSRSPRSGASDHPVETITIDASQTEARESKC